MSPELGSKANMLRLAIVAEREREMREVFEGALPTDEPLVITEDDQGLQRVAGANPAARSSGIEPGMKLASAFALRADLSTRERQPGLEHQALQTIAVWAYGFSSQVAIRPPGHVLLEIGGSLRMYSTLSSLRQELQESWSRLGYVVQPAVGLTPMAAHSLTTRSQRNFVSEQSWNPNPDRLRKQVLALPVTLAPVREQTQYDLHLLGIHTVADLMQLPIGEVRLRFGPELCDWLNRLLGRRADPQPVFTLPDRFSHTVELLAEISNSQALLFPVKRQLAELGSYLEQRQLTTRMIRLIFHHRYGDKSQTELAIITHGVEADGLAFLDLVRLRLESLRLGAAVQRIDLVVERFETLTPVSDDLFAAASTGPALPQLLDRLQARLGNNAVAGLGLNNEHAPEKAWSCQAGELREEPECAYSHNRRPPWLLMQDQELSVTGTKPCWQGPLELLSPAERIDGDWWGKPLCRDYYLARSGSGMLLWIYRERSSNRWFLQGFFS